MITVKENDVYKRERKVEFTNRETITFKLPAESIYEKHESDWYMQIALSKTDLVKNDRHLLTRDLIVNYRDAIREGFNHELDKGLKKPYAYPKNHNTIQGITNYINRIQKASEMQMEQCL